MNVLTHNGYEQPGEPSPAASEQPTTDTTVDQVDDVVVSLEAAKKKRKRSTSTAKRKKSDRRSPNVEEAARIIRAAVAEDILDLVPPAAIMERQTPTPAVIAATAQRRSMFGRLRHMLASII